MTVYVFSLACVFLGVALFYVAYKLHDALGFLGYSIAQLAETLDAGACHECVQQAHHQGMHEDLEPN